MSSLDDIKKTNIDKEALLQSQIHAPSRRSPFRNNWTVRQPTGWKVVTDEQHQAMVGTE